MRSLLRRVLFLFQRNQFDRDLQDELRFHEDMQRAGDQFVIAFARPLIDSSSKASPIQVRLRFVRRAQQLEISIAPGPGRRYPNLIDHKKNVEYDVNRVMRVLGNHFVVSDRLRAVGKWVVVPIRLADVKQTGAK